MNYRERRCALITVAAVYDRRPPHSLSATGRTRRGELFIRMFYAASRCGGVAQTKAEVTFAAVYHFGPRWGTYQTQRPFQTDVDFRRIRDYVESNPDVTLEEIENLDEAALRNFKRKRLR